MPAFFGCNAKHAGLLHDAAQALVVVDVEGFDVASVAILPTTGTFATAVVKVRYANDSSGPFVDFGTPVTLSNATRGSGLLGVVGKYLAVEVTTGEGADCFMDVYVNLRRSSISAAPINA